LHLLVQEYLEIKLVLSNLYILDSIRWKCEKWATISEKSLEWKKKFRKVRKNVKLCNIIFFRFSVPIWDVKEAFPWFTFSEEQQRQKAMLERRKLRIMMRGIKIGRQKGGGRVSLMNVFEIK